MNVCARAESSVCRTNLAALKAGVMMLTLGGRLACSVGRCIVPKWYRGLVPARQLELGSLGKQELIRDVASAGIVAQSHRELRDRVSFAQGTPLALLASRVVIVRPMGF